MSLYDQYLAEAKAINFPKELIISETEYRNVLNSTINILNSDIVYEGVFVSEHDIYYNKDKFDNGDINLCFITGLSGSGKSTMAGNMEKNGVEKYELDDLLLNYKYSDEELKKYGDLFYSFFQQDGKGLRYHSLEELNSKLNPKDQTSSTANPGGEQYAKELVNKFVNYSIKYAATHQDHKFVIEGSWIFLYINPDKIRHYAVYIKGTSAFMSAYRGTMRDQDKYGKYRGLKKFIKTAQLLGFRFNRNGLQQEKLIQKFRDYYNKLESENNINEDTEPESMAIIDKQEIKDAFIKFDECIHNFKIELQKYDKSCIEKDYDEAKSTIKDMKKYLEDAKESIIYIGEAGFGSKQVKSGILECAKKLTESISKIIFGESAKKIFNSVKNNGVIEGIGGAVGGVAGFTAAFAGLKILTVIFDTLQKPNEEKLSNIEKKRQYLKNIDDLEKSVDLMEKSLEEKIKKEKDKKKGE